MSGNEELLITLIAKDSNSDNEGKTVLVMQLPTPVNGRTLRFTEPYYLASYPEDGKGVIEFETQIKFLNSQDTSNIEIQLDSKFPCNTLSLSVLHVTYQNNVETTYTTQGSYYTTFFIS